jgi:peroxiredoxin Q/BCP
VAEAYGVLSSSGLASRWTFYIGPDGRILEVDTDVDVKTAGADIAAKLGELGVAKR